MDEIADMLTLPLETSGDEVHICNSTIDPTEQSLKNCMAQAGANGKLLNFEVKEWETDTWSSSKLKYCVELLVRSDTYEVARPNQWGRATRAAKPRFE